MAVAALDFEKHFFVDHQVNLAIHLTDNKFFQENATIKAIRGEWVQLELFGDGLPPNASAATNARVVVTSKEAWALCRCQGVLERNVNGKEVYLKLISEVDVQQRREYFRWDVFIPVSYSVAEEQQLTTVKQEWEVMRLPHQSSNIPSMSSYQEGFKVTGWKNGEDLLPSNVNLSGNGLRCKVKENLMPGILVHLEIFLPLMPARVIHAVGAVIRTNEIKLNLDSNTYYSTAFHFEFIDDKDRETIISYLFIEQRNTLREKAVKKA